MLRRPITSGSRQAPDPFDQYLESRSMYRKHTARDASCLFRVIAEQMYDTQNYHYEVRLECIRFMTRKRRIFEQHVNEDFDTYLLELAKPKTYGTMLELRALCFLYRRNVILFEPYNLGTTVTYNESFPDCFRVFYTNEYHFDSVYTVDYIEMAAICQSIVFKLLYKMIFKLPDVTFAVESMLHPQTFNWNTYEMEMDANGYAVRVLSSDGRTFEMDLPFGTKCILENYKLCLFHNNSATKQHKQQLEIQAADFDLSANQSSVSEATDVSIDLSAVDSLTPSVSSNMIFLCPHRFNSCVRQVLDDGITPFPYKVAKSLDPNMYRNIEFDNWNAMRKEAKRYNVYANDYDFKVGAKCNVELLIDDDQKLFTCYIQNIDPEKSQCVVFIEKFGNKYIVPYDTLHPVPPDEFRPWAVPSRYQRTYQRVHLGKLLHKSKMNKREKAKIFDIANYFEPTNSDMMQGLDLDTCYGFPSMHNQQHLDYQLQQQMEIHSPIEGNEYQQVHQPYQALSIPQVPQLPMIADGTTGMQTSLASPNAGQFINYMPLPAQPGHGQIPPPWLEVPLPMGEEYSTGIYSGSPISTNGCMVTHFGGLAPSPSVMSIPASPSQPPPPIVASPTILGPQPSSPGSFLMHPNINNNFSSVGPHYDDQSEVRRFMQSNIGFLPTDLSNLRYFYNIGVETHMRLFNNGLIQNHYNTDQQQLQQQNQCYDESSALVGSSTPPPTPDAVTAGAITGTSASNEPTAGRGRTRMRSTANKGRGKRPEQLQNFHSDQQLSHVIMLPTPTPSPNTNANQFSFYPTPLASVQSPQPMPLPPPMYFAAHNGGQSPYAWGMQVPSPGALNVIGMPLEIINNHPKMDTTTVAPNSQHPQPPLQPQLQVLPKPQQISSAPAMAPLH